MSVINESTRDSWQQIANDLSAQYPGVSRRVAVVGGRKHRGKVGTVVRHQKSKFSDAFRYGGEANLHLREMAGRHGFCCLVETDDGERFWVPAEHTEVLAAQN